MEWKPCSAKEGLIRGAWTGQEDKILASYIKAHGEGKWRKVPQKAGLKRCGKSCRLRWRNYLRPDIKRGNISKDEEDLIIRLHKLLGNRWSLIAGRLPGRTGNEIKNYWNKTLGKIVHGQAPQLDKSKISTKSKGKYPITEPPMSDTSSLEATTKVEVIRTKAKKCTLAFFPHNQHHINFQHPQDLMSNKSVSHCQLPSGNHSFTKGSMDVDSTDMGVVGPIKCHGVSLDADKVIQFGHRAMSEDPNSINLGMPSDYPVSFGELTFEDWLNSECFERDITLDVENMASFLNLNGEWF